MSSSITIRPTHGVTQIFLVAVKPVASVDGAVTQLAWGRDTTIQVEPGRREVEVYFPYLGRKSGAARTQVDVTNSSDVHLGYKTPMMVTGSGKITRG